MNANTLELPTKNNTNFSMANRLGLCMPISYNSSDVVFRKNNDSDRMITYSSNVVDSHNSNYQKTVEYLLKIDNTDCEEEENEWGATRPTRYAWQRGHEILREIEKIMKFNFPLGFASLNNDGGIELIWTNYKTRNEIRLSIPSSNEDQISLFVWNEANDKSNLFFNISIGSIIQALYSNY